MNTELLLLIPTAIINILLGLLVILRGPHRSSSRYFAASAFLVFFWAIGDFLLLTSRDPAWLQFGSVLFYTAPMFTTVFLVFFARTFPSNLRLGWLEKSIWLSVTTVFALYIALNPTFLTQTLNVTEVGANTLTVNSVGYTIYSLFFTVGFAFAYINLFLNIRRNTGYRRQQVLYSFIGIFLSSMLAFMTNLTLPIIATGEYIWAGPLFTMAYIAATAVAIVKHRLFDIRLVVARSATYILLLGTLALTYAVVTFGVSRVFFGDQQVTGARDIVYLLLVVFLSFTFQPLKHFFDRITKNLFYRDAYDSQVVLNQIGSTLANTVSVKQLTSEVMEILSEAIKPQTIRIVLSKQTGTRVFGPDMTAEHVEELFKLLRKENEPIVLRDEIADPTSKLLLALEDRGISIAARLKTSKDEIGYILFGYKASGNLYADQDINLIKTAADELAVALQNAERFEEIHDFNKTLQQKVDDATRELRESNKQLKALDVVKDEFISMASHQLRTPLTSIKGYISMLLDGDAGKITPEQHRFLEEAFISSQRMVFLVGDFLNVSRIQTGKFVIDQRPTNLADVAQDEIERLLMTAEHRKIKLSYKKPADFPIINLDEEKLRQVIMNFIDNAIFYSKPGGTVTIELQNHGDEVRFSVADQGIGVPEAEKHRLFGKFFRAANARRSRPDGTGIGLFLAKKVVTIQGGHVFYDSKENVGSTFGFVLPVQTKVVANTKP